MEKKEKIFVYEKSRVNAISLFVLAGGLLFMALIAYLNTKRGWTENGDLVAILFGVIAIGSTFFGIKYFFAESQVWASEKALIVTERFQKEEDRYPRDAIVAILIRKEEQEIVSQFMVFSFTSKSKRWTISLKPKKTDEKVKKYFLLESSRGVVTKLAEEILKHFDWPIEEDNTIQSDL